MVPSFYISSTSITSISLFKYSWVNISRSLVPLNVDKFGLDLGGNETSVLSVLWLPKSYSYNFKVN